jgi:hypothetical protein
MKLRAAAITAILGLIYGTFAFPLNAAEIEGIQFSNTYVAENTKLRLTGVGLLRYWGFKAYVGAFYLEEGSSVDNFMSDTAKRIELEYFRSIKGKDFGPATNKSIAKNVDSKTFDRLRSQIEFHNSLYQDVQPGDRYSLTYVPGRGVGLLFTLTGITVLPVIGLMIAVPVLGLAVVFLAAPRSKACSIIAQKTRGTLNS